jgi:predicted  nucleic acid-binding Zn-ribbon protein
MSDQSDMSILTELRRLTDDLPRLRARVKSATAALKEVELTDPLKEFRDAVEIAKADLAEAKDRIKELMRSETVQVDAEDAARVEADVH